MPTTSNPSEDMQAACVAPKYPQPITESFSFIEASLRHELFNLAAWIFSRCTSLKFIYDHPGFRG